MSDTLPKKKRSASSEVTNMTKNSLNKFSMIDAGSHIDSSMLESKLAMNSGAQLINSIGTDLSRNPYN